MKDIYTFLQSHGTLSVALIIVLLLLFIIEFVRLKTSARRITPTEATHLMNHQNAVMIDIRSLDAFKSGHVAGAIAIPQQDLETQHKKLEKYMPQPIILICASGFESPRAASFLQKHGFNVHVLAGGLRAWKEADMPLIKD